MEVGLKELCSNYYVYVWKLWKVSPCKGGGEQGLYASCHQWWSLEDNTLALLAECEQKLTREISDPCRGNGCCCLTQFGDPSFNGGTGSIFLNGMALAELCC